MTTKPDAGSVAFDLVPGAWLGGWARKKVAPLLEEGHEAHSVTLTGMGERVHLASKEVGIETAIQDALNVIRYKDLDDFVLVGHSFAGKVVAAIADHVPEKVRTLLNLDAFRPAKVAPCLRLLWEIFFEWFHSDKFFRRLPFGLFTRYLF